MRRLALTLVLSLAASGCGLLNVAEPKLETGVNPDDLGRQMSASIDGVAWFARFVTIQQEGTGNIRFTGVLNPGQTSERSIILQFKRGTTGTQTLSSGDAYAQVGVGNSTLQTWATREGGPVGTVTLTTATNNRYVGTFSFEAIGNFSDLTPATRRVTNGTFDIMF